MGNDEHGPAYPDGEFDHFCREHNMTSPNYIVSPYRCPVCNGDQDRYTTCEYPGCPDGRDRGHPHARGFPGDPYLDHAIGPRKRPGNVELLYGCALVLAVILWALWPRPAAAMQISVVVKLCHSLPDIPALVCREESVYTDEMPMHACIFSQAAVADWKDHSIYKGDAWSVQGIKCAAPGYVLKDAI